MRCFSASHHQSHHNMMASFQKFKNPHPLINSVAESCDDARSLRPTDIFFLGGSQCVKARRPDPDRTSSCSSRRVTWSALQFLWNPQLLYGTSYVASQLASQLRSYWYAQPSVSLAVRSYNYEGQQRNWDCMVWYLRLTAVVCQRQVQYVDYDTDSLKDNNFNLLVSYDKLEM